MSTPFMQLYVSDYLGDTQHLTTEQHGAYLLILMTMWRHGGVLPNDAAKLARIARVNLRRWHLVSDDVMAFFDVDGDTITQKRLVQEYQKATSISEKRSANGKAGGAAKSLKNNDVGLANAKQMPQHSQIPDTIKEKEEPIGSSKKARGSRLPADFQPDMQFATEHGLNPSQAQIEVAKFQNYWTAKTGAGATKLDWPATWRNWVLTATKPRHQSTAPPRKSEFQLRQEAIAASFDRKLREGNRNEPFDQTETGRAFDLGPGDWVAH